MNVKKWAFVLSLSFAAVFAGVSLAQNAKGAKGAKGVKRGGTMGRVASIDAAKKTLTLTGRKNETTHVSYTEQTKVVKMEEGKLSDLKSGDVVMVQGNMSGNSVDAQAISLLPATTRLPKKAPKNAPTRNVRGSVSSTSPLKVRMADAEYEVKMTDATKVMTAKEGSVADIKVGDTVRVVGQPGADGVVQAQAIQVGNFVAGKGKGAKKAKANKKSSAQSG
jgi:hypothetical protein